MSEDCVNAIQTKQHLHRLIDEISDDALLKSVEALVVSEVARDVQPMAIAELHDRISHSEEDISPVALSRRKTLKRIHQFYKPLSERAARLLVARLLSRTRHCLSAFVKSVPASAASISRLPTSTSNAILITTQKRR